MKYFVISFVVGFLVFSTLMGNQKDFYKQSDPGVVVEMEPLRSRIIVLNHSSSKSLSPPIIIDDSKSNYIDKSSEEESITSKNDPTLVDSVGNSSTFIETEEDVNLSIISTSSIEDNEPFGTINATGNVTVTSVNPVVAVSKTKRESNKNINTKTNDQLPSCDCTDSNCTTQDGCHRGIIGVHKMGFTVQGKISSLFYKKRKVAITELASHPSIEKNFGPEFRTPSSRDYRHILVVRNLTDSFISGYLYHKSGRECWLDQYGRNVSSYLLWLGHNRGESWERRIKDTATRHIQSWPNGRRRDLCQYLAEESEDDGMRVYMEWAMDIYIRPLVQFWQERRGTNKTMLICFEDQMANFVPTLKKISRFLGLEIPKTEKMTEFHDKLKNSGEGHGTDKDVALSTRLHDLVKRYDRELFNSTLAKWDADFGCSKG